MQETERLEDRESLEGVKSGEIASRLFDIAVAMRSDDARALGHSHRTELAKKSRDLLEKWLADNQGFKLDLSKLRTIVGSLNRFCSTFEGRYNRDNAWSALKEIQQRLNAYLGCLHEWDGLEVGQDEVGLYVICSRCGSKTRDLTNWKPPVEK